MCKRISVTYLELRESGKPTVPYLCNKRVIESPVYIMCYMSGLNKNYKERISNRTSKHNGKIPVQMCQSVFDPVESSSLFSVSATFKAM